MTPQELSKLDYEGASELLRAYATDAKKYEKEIASLRAQAEEWKSKAALARSRSMPELSEAALQKASGLESKAQELSLELVGLRRDIEQLREALPIIKAKQRSVDPDMLLAELSMIVGNPGDEPSVESRHGTTTEGAATSKDAEDALAELKKKMGLL